MNAGLLPLLPRTVQFRKRPYRLLKDRHLFDTEDILTTDTSKDYFRQIGTKRTSQAIFTGDFSLVKEANIFLAVAIQTLVRDRILPKAEWLQFWNKGAFRWDVIVPETVTVDQDRLVSIGSGPDAERFAAVDETVNYGRHYIDRRTFLVGTNKIVPGGRAIEFTIKWEEAGGNGLTATTSVSVIFAGGEYEPGVESAA